MATDYVLAEAIQLIKAGKKDAARVMLERYLQRNPDNVQAWMWEAETFPNDADKIKVLEACLRNNPGNAQATQALNFLKNRAAPPPSKPASPFTTSPFSDSPAPSASSPFTDSYSPTSTSPFAAAPAPAKKPLPFTTDSAPATSSTSPFTTTSPFLTDDAPVADDAQKKPLPVTPPEASAAEKPAAAKKSARKISKTTELLIIGGAVVFFLLLVGGYVGFGFYLNSQINTAFATQQCEEVTQRSSFEAMFPRALFASFFTAYDAYTQCSLKLSLEASVAAEDWSGVLTYAQQYNTLYPQGVFADEMKEQSVQALASWAKSYLDNKNYSSGIEKSRQFIEAYPNHPSVETIRDEILQAYLSWGQELMDAKDYVSAEQYLKAGLDYFATDAVRAPKIKEQLVKVYVALGDAQVAISNMDGAVKYYQQANEISEGATDADLLIARAYLQQALDIADKSDFNRALTKVMEVATNAQSENVQAEADTARQTILQKYAASDGIQALEQINLAIPAVCDGQRPSLPIFGMDTDAARAALFTTITMPLPAEFSATTPGQLHYVACVNETEKEIASCPYEGGAVLYRLRYNWQVTLYDVQTGETIAVEDIKGGEPPACKSKELFTKGVKVKKSYGSKPTADDVAAWLQALGILK